MTAGPGTVLGGRYELVKPLAAGGMGTVWLGRHLELEIEVAIKLVEGSLARRPDLIERFRREARAAAQLKTPHVVQILDYGMDDGTPYIAMELLEGEDLESLLAREKTLSATRVLEILRPLCRALDMAHGAGIVHRDLKPANVFVARVAGDEVIKLVDFGIAKELHRGGEHTTGAAVVGSPLFMSPEQIDEKSAVDARTDVWSLGVMAHLMLSGTTPFVATTIASILYKIVHEPLELPSVHAPSLAPFDTFFTRALARPASDRYATVSELLAGFEAAVSHVDLPDVALPSRTSAAATSATLPMSTSERPPPDAFAPPPPAPAAPTDPAVPVELVDAVAVPADQVSREVAEELLAPASPATAPAESARPNEKPALPVTWIVGGASVVLGAGFAVAVLASAGGADVEATSASAPAASTRSAPQRRGPAALTKKSAKEGRTLEAETSAAAKAPAAPSAEPTTVPSAEAAPSAEPVVEGASSSASGGPSTSPKASSAPRARPATPESPAAPPAAPPLAPAPGSAAP